MITRPEPKLLLIVTAVLIIVVSLFGGTRFSASASAQSQLSLRDAALRVMGGSLVAPGVAAYCEKYVEANPSLLDAAQQWNRRNASIMKRTVEALKLSGGISNEEKDILGRSAFKWTKKLVENNNDRKEFCRNAVTNINNGSLDIDKMEGLTEAYKLVSSRAE